MSINEWSFIMSIVALVMAVVTLPTVFQMYGGKPSIDVSPNVHDIKGVRVLRFFIRNRPVTSRFLKTIGVVRQATDILVNFNVCEAGSGKVVTNMVRAQLRNERHERAMQISLASYIPAIVALIICDEEGSSKIITEEELSAGVPVTRGRYRIQFNIIYAHNRHFKFTAEFSVGNKPEDPYWTGKAEVLQRG
jgi:hypothetical protein